MTSTLWQTASLYSARSKSLIISYYTSFYIDLSIEMQRHSSVAICKSLHLNIPKLAYFSPLGAERNTP